MRILFVTWDGPELSYLQSLFLPIFRQLRDAGISTDVLQFRWGERALTGQVAEACAEAGSRYRAVSVSRRFGGAGSLLSALGAARHVRRAVRDWSPDAIMPRSLMPALATLSAGGSRLRPIIFDADGLPADERVEFAGLSPRSLTYRILRDVESQMVRHSASVIVRSSKAREILLHRAGPPVKSETFHVVSNGRDEGKFRPASAEERLALRHELRIEPAAPLIVYVGSVGAQYRFAALAELTSQIKRLRSDARLLVLSGEPDRARAELASTSSSVAAEAMVLSVPPHLVARYVAAADIAVAYRQAGFATQAVAPIKLSEYLLCGVPVIGTAGVGETAAAVEAGVFLNDFSGSEAAARWVVNEVLPDRDRFRQVARTVGLANFSLGRSVEAYLAALAPMRERLLSSGIR